MVETTVYYTCPHCGEQVTRKLSKRKTTEKLNGKEVHLGPDGATWHYSDGSIVGYGGYYGYT